MNDQRFLDHLDRFGPDLDTWPRADAARELLGRSARARAALAEAQALDRLLRATCLQAGDDFADRVIAAALDRPQQRPLPAPVQAPAPRLRWRWLVLPQLAGATAALVIGLWVGASQVAAPGPAVTANAVSLTGGGDDDDSLLSAAIQGADGVVAAWDDV